MRPRLALGLLLLFLAPACGGGSTSAASVVEAWSSALNAGNNERAASLFAPGAEVVQLGQVLELWTTADAFSWNAALPCSGRIVALTTRGDTATATFVLGDRKTSRCDGPGGRVTAVFEVHGGKIVLWHETRAQAAPPPADIA